jgi:heat shock protein HslJ
MTQPHLCRTRTELSSRLLPRARGWFAGCALLATLAGGCGGQSRSTDTGNPPVIGQKLHLTATATGVVVSGDPGAAPAGARVDVINTATAETVSTTAAEDGSFQIEIAGAATDEYQVYIGSGQESWRTRLTSSGNTTPETGIDGRVFLLQTTDGYTPRVPSPLQLSFEDGQLSFRASCNSFFGQYSVCGGRLCVSDLGGTLIGCDSDLQEQDEWFADFFTASPELSLAGAALRLRTAAASLELLDREVATPDLPLTGRQWMIDTLVQNGAASNIPGGIPPVLSFDTDGKLSVFDGCNNGGANYTRSGQTLTLSSVSFDERACDGTRSTEEGIHAVIAEGELSFEIDANRLTLTRGGSGLSAVTGEP